MTKSDFSKRDKWVCLSKERYVLKSAEGLGTDPGGENLKYIHKHACMLSISAQLTKYDGTLPPSLQLIG